MWQPSPRIGAAAILAWTLAIYAPCLGGAYLWDDESYVTRNVALRSLPGLADIWRIPPTTPQYYPVTFTSFWLEYRLWGDTPFFYHLTNVVLHGANAVLVWRLLAALEVPGAFLTAWLFAAHPVHVESVAWIAERKNVLSGLFALIAAREWLRFLAGRRRGRLMIVGAACLAAVLSKTQSCVLPIVLVLLGWLQHAVAWRRLAPPLAALTVAGMAAAAITVAVEPLAAPGSLPVPQLSIVERILVAGRAVWFYAGTLLWPHDLMTIYPRWAIDPGEISAYGWPLAAAALAGALWTMRARIGRGPIVALTAYVALLAPALGFVDFGFMRFAFVADHLQYLASIPLLALVVATGSHACGALATRHTLPARLAAAHALQAGLAAAVVAGLGMATWQRAVVHRSPEALWRDNIRRNPAAAPPYDHLGHVLVDQGRLDEARDAFSAAALRNDQYVDAIQSLANVLKEQGRLDEAIAEYGRVLRLVPTDPVVHNNLGVVHQMRGDLDSATRHFAEAIRLDARYAAPYNNWGALLLARGDAAAAIDRFAVAVRIDPTYAEAYDNWGAALMALGRFDDAAERLATAANLLPESSDIRSHWGTVLARAGRLEEATVRLEEALRLRPDNHEARDNLAQVLAERDGAARTAPR